MDRGHLTDNQSAWVRGNRTGFREVVASRSLGFFPMGIRQPIFSRLENVENRAVYTRVFFCMLREARPHVDRAKNLGCTRPGSRPTRLRRFSLRDPRRNLR